MRIVVGPVHAGIIEPGRFTFESGGESVLHLEAQLGFSRRGVESALAGREAVGAARGVARICGACSAARSWAYALALESLAGARCDAASDLRRVVIAELERAYNHVFDLACACAAVGYARGQTRGLGLKERLHRLNAVHAGHRLLFDAIVPGGVRSGLLVEPERLARDLRPLARDIERFAADIFENSSVARRLAGTGGVDAQRAMRLGAVGPAHRASGGCVDQRITRPYGAYSQLALKAAGAHAGDAEARCRVKAAELATSMALLQEALGRLSGLDPRDPQPLVVGMGAAAAAVEGARGSESVSVAIDDNGLVAQIDVQSASRANWPVVVEAMRGNILPDFPLVNKSFNLCYACADL